MIILETGLGFESKRVLFLLPSIVFLQIFCVKTVKIYDHPCMQCMHTVLAVLSNEKG